MRSGEMGARALIRTELCPIKTSDVLSGLKSPLVEKGYSFRLARDFRKLKQIMERFGKPLTEPFDPGYTDFTPATGFYIQVLDRKGDVVATNAFRLFQLGGITLEEFIVQSWARLYSYRSKTRVTLKKKQIPLFRGIREDTIYGGEMYVHRDHRGEGIGNILGRYGIIASFLYWPGARHMFALMLRSSVDSGFGAMCGFQSQTELGIRWKKPSSEYPFNLSVVYQSLEGVIAMIDAMDHPRYGETRHTRLDGV